jgi:hypothetical protein
MVDDHDRRLLFAAFKRRFARFALRAVVAMIAQTHGDDCEYCGVSEGFFSGTAKLDAKRQRGEFRVPPPLIDLVWNDPKNTAYLSSGRQRVDRPLFFYALYEVFAHEADCEARNS